MPADLKLLQNGPLLTIRSFLFRPRNCLSTDPDLHTNAQPLDDTLRHDMISSFSPLRHTQLRMIVTMCSAGLMSSLVKVG